MIHPDTKRLNYLIRHLKQMARGMRYVGPNKGPYTSWRMTIPTDDHGNILNREGIDEAMKSKRDFRKDTFA